MKVATCSPEPDDEKAPKSDKGRDWLAIRTRYENGRESILGLARALQIPKQTMQHRAWKENWKQNHKLAKTLVREAVVSIEKQVHEQARKMVENELAPYIERQKDKITRRGIKIGNRGLSRIEKLWRNKKPDSTREESDGARAAETFLRIARTSLGMSEGVPVAGPLSPILISHSAVQIVRQDQPPGAPNESQK